MGRAGTAIAVDRQRFHSSALLPWQITAARGYFPMHCPRAVSPERFPQGSDIASKQGKERK
jgi:hypothetical protein